MVTIMVGGLLLATRVNAIAAANSNDWEEAGVLSLSSCEQALSAMNYAASQSSTWRSNFNSGQVYNLTNLGRGTMSWVPVDSDGNFSDNYSQSFTLYGIGKVGKTQRIFSMTVNAGGHGLDVLRMACHCDGLLTTNNTTNATLGGPAFGGSLTGGALSTNNTAKLNGTVNAAVECVASTGGASPTGGITYPGTKLLPPASVFDTYKTTYRATVIPSTAATSNTFSPGTLTATSNPAGGGVNSDGLYYLKVPSANDNTQIKTSRIQGTLLIESSNSSQKLEIMSDVSWAAQRSDYPILIVKGFSRVKIDGQISTVTIGLNAYPTELKGLIHIIGSTTDVQVGDAACIRGCLVTDGTITTSGTTTFVADPNLYNSPPLGYCKGDVLTPAAGGWKWDQWP